MGFLPRVTPYVCCCCLCCLLNINTEKCHVNIQFSFSQKIRKTKIRLTLQGVVRPATTDKDLHINSPAPWNNTSVWASRATSHIDCSAGLILASGLVGRLVLSDLCVFICSWHVTTRSYPTSYDPHSRTSYMVTFIRTLHWSTTRCIPDRLRWCAVTAASSRSCFQSLRSVSTWRRRRSTACLSRLRETIRTAKSPTSSDNTRTFTQKCSGRRNCEVQHVNVVYLFRCFPLCSPENECKPYEFWVAEALIVLVFSFKVTVCLIAVYCQFVTVCVVSKGLTTL